MQNISIPQRQLRWALIGAAMCAAAAATLWLVWPAAAYDSNPRSHDVIGQAPSTPDATPWPQVEDHGQAAARGLLAQRLGVPADSLTFVGAQAVNWPDTSLGCPKPGYVYAKVIVPGYRITFAHDGSNYEVHTAAKSGFGQSLPPVSCQGGLAYERPTDDSAGFALCRRPLC